MILYITVLIVLSNVFIGNCYCMANWMVVSLCHMMHANLVK